MFPESKFSLKTSIVFTFHLEKTGKIWYNKANKRKSRFRTHAEIKKYEFICKDRKEDADLDLRY